MYKALSLPATAEETKIADSATKALDSPFPNSKRFDQEHPENAYSKTVWINDTLTRILGRKANR